MNYHEEKPILKDKNVLWILLIGLLVRIISTVLIPPGFDEAYYGLYARFLSFGYFDHPPLVALTAGIGEWLFGNVHQFSLRFGALVLFVPSAILMFKITNILFGRKAGIYSLILLHTFPYFLIGMGAFVIPDNALGFTWLLFIYSLVKLRASADDKWLLLTGLSLGLGLLAKYHSVLLFPSFFFILLFYKDWRRYFKSIYLYIALLVSVIVFLPNIYWNYEHNWVSYVFQFGKSAENNSLSLNLFLQGIFVQAGYLLPWNLIVVFIAVYKYFSKKHKEVNWLIPFVLLPIVAFTAIGASRQILPHWPMPGYLIGIILTAGYFTMISVRTRNIIFGTSSLLIIAAVSVLSLQALTGFIKLEKNQDLTLDGQGWSEVINYISTNDSLKNNFVFTHKWFTAGELGYFSKGKLTVTMLNEEAAHGFPFWISLDSLYGKDGIYISTDRYPAKPEEIYKDHFTEYLLVKQIKTYRGSSEAQVFDLWLCRKLNTTFKYPY